METWLLGLFLFSSIFTVLSFVLGFAQAELPIPGIAGVELGGGEGHGVSPFNVSTVLAFLTWFGGIGYLLATATALPVLAVLGLSGLGGGVGAAVVFVALARVLLAGQTAPMRAEDYRLQGTLARVTFPIAPSGTGEIVYEKGGTTRSEGARSANGAAIPRGAEVVVLRYERGIAYVEPLDALLAEREATPRLRGEREGT